MFDNKIALFELLFHFQLQVNKRLISSEAFIWAAKLLAIF